MKVFQPLSTDAVITSLFFVHNQIVFSVSAVIDPMIELQCNEALVLLLEHSTDADATGKRWAENEPDGRTTIAMEVDVEQSGSMNASRFA